MTIFTGFPGGGASEDSGVVENADFQCYILEHLEMRPKLLRGNNI